MKWARTRIGDVMQSVTRFLLLWVIGFAVFTLMDLVWLGVVAAPLYSEQVGGLLNPAAAMSTKHIAAALLTWLLIILGLMSFVLPRARQKASIVTAFALGALFGFILYGVYDLTNLAVLKEWTWTVTIVDIAWGTFACGTASLILYGLETWLTRRSCVTP